MEYGLESNPPAADNAWCSQFERDGFLIVRKLAAPALCQAMLSKAKTDLKAEAPPLEYESDVQYPGSPATRDAPGGHTVRRLLQAYARATVFRDWATHTVITPYLRALLGPKICLAQAHHNCIMTKEPGFSSDTLWHQDIRYWSYTRPELINTWLALGREYSENGGLMILPGTHRMRVEAQRLDANLFLRKDLAENRALMQTQVAVELEPGDVLFFHARAFHAASRNRTDKTKFSVVFTYHAADNSPKANSRSSSIPSISL